METKNMWQQATITFAENNDFKKLVTYHGIPRFTTGKQLLDIGHMVNAMA
ncbi:14666_t:CDS:2 [Funneliformis geosporum]|nr:14666_t:CDS:2 [Funneliformis geosporum]